MEKVIKHQLEYCTHSTKVSWCPICKEHYYNDSNEIHTTKASDNHFHIVFEELTSPH